MRKTNHIIAALLLTLLIFISSCSKEQQYNYWMEMGKKKLASGKYQEAEKDFTRAVKTDLSNPSAYDLRGYCLWNLKKYDEALKDANKAIKLNPEINKYYLLRARINTDLLNYNEVISDCDRILRTNPSNKEAIFYKSQAFFRLGKSRESLDILNEAIKSYPDYTLFYNTRAGIYTELQQYEDAARDLQKLIDSGMNKSIAYGNMASIRLCQGRYDEAIEMVSKAIELNPEESRFYSIRMGLNYLSGNKDEAMNDLQRIKKLKPDDLWSDIYHYLLSIEDENPKGQIEILNQSIDKADEEKWPGPIILMFTNKISPIELVKLSEKETKNPVTDNYRRSDAYYYAGKFHEINGEYTEAAEYYEKCLKTEAQMHFEYQLAKLALKKLKRIEHSKEAPDSIPRKENTTEKQKEEPASKAP